LIDWELQSGRGGVTYYLLVVVVSDSLGQLFIKIFEKTLAKIQTGFLGV
jgi:hypothetical protein